MGIKWAADARTIISATAAAAVLAVGLAACGGINGPATSPTTTVTATAPASQAPAANSSATPASQAADAAAGDALAAQLPDKSQELVAGGRIDEVHRLYVEEHMLRRRSAHGQRDLQPAKDVTDAGKEHVSRKSGRSRRDGDRRSL